MEETKTRNTLKSDLENSQLSIDAINNNYNTAKKFFQMKDKAVCQNGILGKKENQNMIAAFREMISKEGQYKEIEDAIARIEKMFSREEITKLYNKRNKYPAKTVKRKILKEINKINKMLVDNNEQFSTIIFNRKLTAKDIGKIVKSEDIGQNQVFIGTDIVKKSLNELFNKIDYIVQSNQLKDKDGKNIRDPGIGYVTNLKGELLEIMVTDFLSKKIPRLSEEKNSGQVIQTGNFYVDLGNSSKKKGARTRGKSSKMAEDILFSITDEIYVTVGGEQKSLTDYLSTAEKNKKGQIIIPIEMYEEIQKQTYGVTAKAGKISGNIKFLDGSLSFLFEDVKGSAATLLQNYQTNKDLKTGLSNSSILNKYLVSEHLVTIIGPNNIFFADRKGIIPTSKYLDNIAKSNGKSPSYLYASFSNLNKIQDTISASGKIIGTYE